MNQNANVNRRAEEEDVIDLLEIFYLIRRNLLLLIIAGLVGGLAVGGISYFLIAPKYESTAKIYAVSSSSGSVVNLQDLQLGTNLTADYKELVLSRPVMESAIQNLGLDYTVKELSAMVGLTNPANTRILAITATSTDPKEAAAIANEIAEIAIAWLPAVMECPVPHIAEDAIVPLEKCAPSNAKNAVIGAVASAVIVFGILLVRFLMDDTVHNADDLEKYFGIMPLAVIPQENEIDDEEEDRQAAKYMKAQARKSQKRGGK